MISWPISPPNPNTFSSFSFLSPLLLFHIPYQEPPKLMAEEGFSFPGIPDPSACSICSPPLWPVSPPPAPPLRDRSSSRGSDEGDLGEMADGEGGGLREEEEEEEEKMDMLWEDFNEELPRSHGHPDVSSSWSSTSTSTSSREAAGVGGVEAQTVSRTKGALVSARRAPQPGVVVLIKVLKKLFLLHHGHKAMPMVP